MKQTTTMTSEHGTFTMTSEVVELTNTAVEASLFEMPPGCPRGRVAYDGWRAGSAR
jgi:hypothetical protein